jgi:hypothetical protein
MPSMRAEAVAEVLWELKRLERLATCTEVAERAGFKPGVNGKNLLVCLDSVRRDWPHLQWWRVLQDDCCLPANGPQANALKENGYTLDSAEGRPGNVQIVDIEFHLHSWTETPNQAEAPA